MCCYFVQFQSRLLLSVLSKVYRKISASFRLIQNINISDLAMAKVENVKIGVTYFQETSQLQNRKRPLAGKPRRLPETKIRTKMTTYFRSRETGPDQPPGPNVMKLFTSIFTNVCDKLKCFALASVTKLVLCL